MLAFSCVPTVDSNQAPIESPNPTIAQEATIRLNDHDIKSNITNLGKRQIEVEG